MTNENPRAAEALESFGFSFAEQSSTRASIVPTAADLQTAAPEDLPSVHSTELVSMSRRALREKERSRSTNRPGRRLAGSETVEYSAETTVPAGGPRSVFTPAAGPLVTRQAAARPSLDRRIVQKTFPPVVMLAATALLVGTSVPAAALFDPKASPTSTVMASTATSDAAAIDPELTQEQIFEVEAGAELTVADASRDDWSVTSYAEMLRLKYGNRTFSYSTSGSGAVRWPFPAAVPISSGFGERVAPCRGCSSYHKGLDFNPGAGTPIYAIADGIVLEAEYSGGFGQHAIIEHTVNGQRVTSVYAHMTGGSSPLVPGQQVLVGDLVGTVGNTGLSTGAHLHLEIKIDDIAVDPFEWFRANAS